MLMSDRPEWFHFVARITSDSRRRPRLAHAEAVRCPALGLSIVALAATESSVGLMALVDALLDAA